MRLIISVLLVVSSLLFVQENNKQHKDEFALVDGGSFMMGSEDGEDSEQPVHKVTLNSFYIGKYEVTQGEWQSLMGDDTPYKKLGPNYPVHHIDFYSALAYCNKKSINEGLTPCYSIDGKTNIEEANTWGSSLPECNFEANGYRLPTEAEWEYAARGGKLSKGFTFSGSDEVDVVAWLLWSCMENNDKRIKKHLSKIVNAVKLKNDGHQRELLIILSKMELSSKHEGVLFDICMNVWEQISKSPSVRMTAFKFIIKIAQKHSELKREIPFLVQDHLLESLSPGVKRSISKMMKEFDLELG